MITRWVRDFIHNCLVHPLLPFLPTEMGDRLHDRNARWAFPEPETHEERAARLLELAENEPDPEIARYYRFLAGMSPEQAEGHRLKWSGGPERLESLEPPWADVELGSLE